MGSSFSLVVVGHAGRPVSEELYVVGVLSLGSWQPCVLPRPSVLLYLTWKCGGHQQEEMATHHSIYSMSLLFLWTCLGLYPTAAQQSQVALALNSKSRGCGRKRKTRTSPVYLTRVVPEAQQCCREGYQVCFCASEWTPVQVFLFSALFLSPQHNKALTVFAGSWTFLSSLSKRKLKIPMGALKKRVHSYWPQLQAWASQELQKSWP